MVSSWLWQCCKGKAIRDEVPAGRKAMDMEAPSSAWKAHRSASLVHTESLNHSFNQRFSEQLLHVGPWSQQASQGLDIPMGKTDVLSYFRIFENNCWILFWVTWNHDPVWRSFKKFLNISVFWKTGFQKKIHHHLSLNSIFFCKLLKCSHIILLISFSFYGT